MNISNLSIRLFCLYTIVYLSKKGADINKIKYVASHIQALEQTRNNRNRLYPNWKEIEANDTASAARNLSEGIFTDDYAVICRKNAEYYDLQLVHENIEDIRNNRTELRVYKNTSMDYSEKTNLLFGSGLHINSQVKMGLVI